MNKTTLRHATITLHEYIQYAVVLDHQMLRITKATIGNSALGVFTDEYGCEKGYTQRGVRNGESLRIRP